MCNSVLSKICLLLAIIGGLNWGFVGIWKLDIVAWLQAVELRQQRNGHCEKQEPPPGQVAVLSFLSS